MKVAFSAEALNDSDSARYLTSIWWMTVDGRHQWIVPALGDLYKSGWLAGQGRALQRAIRDDAALAARRSSTPEVEVAPVAPSCAGRRGNSWHVSAERAERWLRQPAVVVVENGFVDGTFLRLVALRVGEKRLSRALGPERFRRLRERWRSPTGDADLVEVRHGGGSTIGMVIEMCIDADGQLPPRMLVMVDSDRGSVNAKPGRTAARALRVCSGAPTFGGGWSPAVWVSRKREVENYLPHGAIKKVSRWPAATFDSDHGDLKTVFHKNLAQDVLTRAERELHAAAFRERCGDHGKELDQLVELLVTAL